MDTFIRRFFVLTILGSFLIFVPGVSGGPRHFAAPPKTVPPIQYKIKDLSANLFSDNSILYITGKLQNTSFHPIQGVIIVRILDGNSTDIGYVETGLNQNLPIGHNEMGDFGIAVDVKGESGIKKVFVEFVSTKK